MISILMASHNANKIYFQECMHSILNQSYDDFEIVIVDDCSDISVEQLLLELDIMDERIAVIRSDMNIGLPRALNLGMKYCKGEYIARMDDDDIMERERLEKQCTYMTMNPEYIGCFSSFERIDRWGNHICNNWLRIEPVKIKKQLLSSGNIFCHSSLFVKKSILEEISGYDENLRYAQDCDLYIRLLDKGSIGIVADSLVKFRINDYRTNMYRDCLSLTYSYFSALRYFCSSTYKAPGMWLCFFERTARYFVGCVKLISKSKSGKG